MAVIDWPNSPNTGDEFQCPNKFVYEWTNGNRWKNIHRPLILPDYIWPPFDDPDATPNTDGGGGDDWTIEVLDFPVANGQLTSVIEMVVPQDPLVTTDPRTTGSVGVQRIANFNTGGAAPSGRWVDDPIAKMPNLACQGIISGIPIAQAGITPTKPVAQDSAGNKVFCNAQFSTISFTGAYAVTWVRLDEIVSATGMNNLSDVRWRYTYEASDISYNASATEPIEIFAYGADINELAVAGSLGSGQFYPPVAGASYDSGWANLSPDCVYLMMQIDVGEGREIGNMTIYIEDPYGTDARNNLPVGFACNPELSRSIVSFSGLSGPILRTMSHYDPKRLSNTQYDQTEDGDDSSYLDLVTSAPVDVNWTSLYLRENEEMYMFVDSANPQVVQSRHLYTPGDFTTHSVISAPYDYRDFASQTPSLGYDVQGIRMSPDGTYLFALDDSGNIRRYTLSTDWDLSTVVAGTYDTLNLGGWGATCFDITIDGLAIIVFKAGLARQVLLETAWDITTTINSGIERAFSTIQNPVDVCVSDDTLTMFILDIPTDPTSEYRIYSYTRNQ